MVHRAQNSGFALMIVKYLFESLVQNPALPLGRRGSFYHTLFTLFQGLFTQRRLKTDDLGGEGSYAGKADNTET